MSCFELLGLLRVMFVWLGRRLAPSKCVFLSTSRVVRKDMRGWVVTDEGDRWTVKLDIRDLGGHLDTTFRGWSSTLATRVRVAIARLVVVFCIASSFSLSFGCSSEYVYSWCLAWDWRLPFWLSLVFVN